MSAIGVYNGFCIHPRPSRDSFSREGLYIKARDEWKARYPNLHTEEEELAHYWEMSRIERVWRPAKDEWAAWKRRRKARASNRKSHQVE